ncbi:MAG: hypothetical protein KTR25_18380 [Myxococcales bacterium]|nr:hypothetical protein [Myxococcales bacterium]
MRAGLDQPAARPCLCPPAAEVTPYPTCVRGRPQRKGTGVTGREARKDGEATDPSHTQTTRQNTARRLSTRPIGD